MSETADGCVMRPNSRRLRSARRSRRWPPRRRRLLWSRLTDVQTDAELLAYMEMGDDYLGAIGYTEHGLRHANLTAHIAGNILRRLGYDERDRRARRDRRVHATTSATASRARITGSPRRSSRATRSLDSACRTTRSRRS